jgi:hypothetical protein
MVAHSAQDLVHDQVDVHLRGCNVHLRRFVAIVSSRPTSQLVWRGGRLRINYLTNYA